MATYIGVPFMNVHHPSDQSLLELFPPFNCQQYCNDQSWTDIFEYLCELICQIDGDAWKSRITL